MTFTYRVLLRPKDICFRKKLLPSSFDNGIPLRETLQQLLNEEILVEDVPSIDVVWCKEKWAWYTLSNRRLWVFRELEKKGKCQYIATKRVETIEHVTDFLLYGSAELIGESPSVSWDSDDGLKITLFKEAEDKQDQKSAEEVAKVSVNTELKDRESDQNKPGDNQSRKVWREMTPLTIKITWPGVVTNCKNIDDRRTVQSLKSPENLKRERKDSGFSETSSGRSIDKSRANSESENEDEGSVQENKSDRKRFSKFHRYRPYSPRPRPARKRKRHVQQQSAVLQRKEVYERMLFILHHGDKPRNEQHILKNKLMNTCGFCFKNFKAGVSLSQHVEELGHWACTRCGKYFKSYTALGQHKLSLDHCNL